MGGHFLRGKKWWRVLAFFGGKKGGFWFRTISNTENKTNIICEIKIVITIMKRILKSRRQIHTIHEEVKKNSRIKRTEPLNSSILIVFDQFRSSFMEFFKFFIGRNVDNDILCHNWHGHGNDLLIIPNINERKKLASSGKKSCSASLKVPLW